MINNFYITESQFNRIKNINKENKISRNLLKMIGDENSPINNNTPIIKNGLKNLLLNGYDESISYFKDDITQFTEDDIANKLSKLISIAKKKEQPITRQLEGLCENIICNFTNNKIEIDCKLVNEISQSHLFHVNTNTENYEIEYDSIEQYNNIEEQVKKRKILNTLSMGCALDLYNLFFDKYLKELFKLDEDLPHLYSKIMKINNHLTYISKQNITEKQHFQSGFVEVKLGKNCEITTVATLFPFLLIESFRGVLESISSKEFIKSIKNSGEIFSRADILEFEPYYMTIGNMLWKKIYKLNNIKYILPFFKEISSLECNKFVSLFNEIVADTKYGKDEVNDLLNSSVNKTDYSDFEQDITKRNDKYNLILSSDLTNGDLLVNELNEANYPQSFNMEHFKSLTSFNQRINYCNSTLERLGSGSSRIVYLIDDNTVLKLAKNKKGVAQNEREIEVGTSSYYQGFNLFAEVYEYDDNGLWLEMQYARRSKKNDFKRILGVDFIFLQDFIQFTANHYLRNDEKRGYISQENEKYFGSDEFWEKIDNDYTIFNSIYDMLLNETTKSYSDLQKLNSWGVVKDNDGERLVLIDFGLTDDIFDNYYRH